MKLYSFIFLLLCSAQALPSQAQILDGKARFGLRLGVTGSNLYDDAKAEDRNGRIGLLGGAFLKVPLGKSSFAIRPEVLYATRGATFKRDSFISSIKSSYIEVPLSLEYNLSIVNVHAGLNASLLANANGEFKDEQGNPIDFDKEDLEKLDLGWHLGAGLDLGRLGVHLRVDRGLKKVGGGQTLSDLVGDLKNSAWSLTLVYGF